MRHMAAIVLTAVAALSGAAKQPSTGRTALEGVWRSQGYGIVFEIRGPKLKVFELTATTCVLGTTGTVDVTPEPGREATLSVEDGDPFLVRTGGTADHKVLHVEGSASDLRIDRLPQLPAVCARLTPNTPPDNFEVFARTFAEHYIAFDLKKTDWAKVVEANRSKVTARTTPTELFDVLEGMIAPLGDPHTYLRSEELKRQVGRLRPGTDRLLKGGPAEFRRTGMPALQAVTERAYLKGELRSWCKGQVRYGHVDEAIGYLRIQAFAGYTDDGGFASSLAALETALDEIFSDPGLKALVIDARINFGGSDVLALAVASRLATTEYLAYTKDARADAVDRNKWTPGDPSVVRPSARPGFRGSVVELTGPLTISAGETFTQALMGRTPRIIRIGENTQGVFSDVLGRRLPNGWVFGLPNEVFRTPEGAIFDAVGIAPDIAVPVFADEDVAAGKDPAMANALQLLRGK
jgi:C-terminal processing protease CtpA/Prc